VKLTAVISFLFGVLLGFVWSNWALYLIMIFGIVSLFVHYFSRVDTGPKWIWRHSDRSQDLTKKK